MNPVNTWITNYFLCFKLQIVHVKSNLKKKLNSTKCHCKYMLEAWNGNFDRLALNLNLCENKGPTY